MSVLSFGTQASLLHRDSASAVVWGDGWYAGWDLDDNIDLGGSEGLEGKKVDNI